MILKLCLNYVNYQAKYKAKSAIQALKQIESIMVFLTEVKELKLKAKILRKNLYLTLMPNLHRELYVALVGLILDNSSYENRKKCALRLVPSKRHTTKDHLTKVESPITITEVGTLDETITSSQAATTLTTIPERNKRSPL